MRQDGQREAIRILERAVLSEGWSRLERVSFEQPAGENGGCRRLERENDHRGAAVAVLPVDRERGTVLLVRQLRLPALLNGDGPMLIEACAGIIDGADGAADTALREAEEELGVRLHGLRPLFALSMSPGACTEKLHLFATHYSAADRFGAGGGLAGEGERIEVLEPTPFRGVGHGRGRADQRCQDRGAAAAGATGARPMTVRGRDGWGRRTG